MFGSSRKIFLRLAVLCLLDAGVFVAQRNTVSAKNECPVCPVPYHCNFWTMGNCVCDCPNPDDTCPAACA